jgi:ABC-type anion transport system duplicated permease subunit
VYEYLTFSLLNMMKKKIVALALMVANSATAVMAVDNGDVLGASDSQGDVLGATGMNLVPVAVVAILVVIAGVFVSMKLKKNNEAKK